MVRIFRPKENPIQITLAEVATHDSISAAGTIVNVVRFPGSLLLCCALLLIGLPSRAAADVFTVALTSPVDRLGFATTTATVMGPTTLNTTMLVDTGAAVGFAFDTNSLFSAFLVDGMVVPVRGVGGNASATRGATVPMLSIGFTPAPTIPGGQVATQPNFPMTFESLPLPVPKGGTIGMNYLTTFASVAFDNNMGTPISMVLDTTRNVSQARPNNADSEAAAYTPSGTFPDGSADLNTNVFSVPIQVSSIDGTPVVSNFVIDSSVEDSLDHFFIGRCLGAQSKPAAHTRAESRGSRPSNADAAERLTLCWRKRDSNPRSLSPKQSVSPAE
jgi:hypothetical protein